MDHDLKWIRLQRSLPGPKKIDPNKCNLPGRVINIDATGRVFVCRCESWLPWSIGHLLDFDTLDDIWNHPTTIEIRSSQLVGEYKYCDTQYCGVDKLSGRMTDQKIEIYLGIDDSCQLACPSCRNEQKFEKNYELKKPWSDHVVNLIKNYSGPSVICVLIGAHGDPLASDFYRYTMNQLSNLPVLFQLRTNGLLLKKHLAELRILPNLTELEISIDAASMAIYEQVRWPGKWSSLLENLEYVQEARKQKYFKVVANFVVQASNYTEMLDFVDLCNKYDMVPDFTLLQDWNTFDYKENAVHFPTHKNYQDFCRLAQSPIIKQHVGTNFDRWIKT
jgi:molybdenum cofactor biosynthesis enzyme MoaA